MSAKRKATFPHGEELMCKNGCGFYGNREWQGYCSKCHKEINEKVSSTLPKVSTKKKVARSYSDAQDSLFTKFEEKKKQHLEKRSKTIKSIIKRGQSAKESTTQSPSHELVSHVDVFQVGKDLSLKESTIKDVFKQIQRQLEKMNKLYDQTIDVQSETMQAFYNWMNDRCENHNIYQDLTPEQIEALMDKIEEQLMTYLHRTVFQQISSEYEDKDLALQKRIRSLNWMTPQLLGTDIKENSPEVRDLIDKAITDVIEMDSKVAPQQKLSSIVSCSKNICDIINLCQGIAASADEFLPTLVYIVLKANPPLLQSNIKYITSYSIPARLRCGEGAYFFTNLCCAVAFIEDLSAESLNLSSEEFERYLSGEAIPTGYAEQNAAPCEGLRLMHQNLLTLGELHEKHKKMMTDFSELQEDMIKFQETIDKSLPAPYVINETPYTIPADVDMSLIPELLRCRVARQPPKDDILVDISSKGLSLIDSESDGDKKASTTLPQPIIKESQNIDIHPISDFHKISFDTPLSIPLDVPPIIPESDTSELQNLLPPIVPLSSATINIKDLKYPTELFPDVNYDESILDSDIYTDSLDFAYETNIASQETSSGHPLSPETGFIEENPNLPPPLLPVVLQNLNSEANKN